MSLIKREPSAAQSDASRANGSLSAGPRTEHGKVVSSRNLPKPRAFSDVVARSMIVLGESRKDFRQMHDALAEAMAPRDAWEAAWVQDIAILRWRLARLQRAEVGITALRRRRLDHQRRRAVFPPTGSSALKINSSIGILGFTGIPDSTTKFQQVIEHLEGLRDIAQLEMFEQDVTLYFSLLYGKSSNPHDAVLRSHFESVAEKYREGHSKDAAKQRDALIADLNGEIASWEQRQSLYAAEYLEADQVQQDAELLLPGEDMDGIIRYETHLEDHIERKLCQFYARRRESLARPAEVLPEIVEQAPAGEVAGKAAVEA